ncbi:ATP-binding protein [Streptomyces sp. NPDC005573]|uniref:ATP-binding protein n=1 Tax=Streptomyces sp. NPDC005573 TaxID=3156890 RepID=UPI0033BDA405
MIEDVELAVSELVTNAIEYGTGDAVALRLRFPDSDLLIEVEAGNTSPAALRNADEGSESGRGLWLIAAFARD